jgi:hypothetical protein
MYFSMKAHIGVDAEFKLIHSELKTDMDLVRLTLGHIQHQLFGAQAGGGGSELSAPDRAAKAAR